MNIHRLPAELPVNAGLDPCSWWDSDPKRAIPFIGVIPSQWDSDPNGAVPFIGIICSQQDSHPNGAVSFIGIICSQQDSDPHRAVWDHPFPVGYRSQQVHRDHPFPAGFRYQWIHWDHPILFPGLTLMGNFSPTP